MKPCIVITSINGPDRIQEWHNTNLPVFVVADNKTPLDGWEGCLVTIEQQQWVWPELAAAIPYNHYARKMLGYLWAKENGFTHVFETDDDNYPMDPLNFGNRLEQAVQTERMLTVQSSNGWFNHFAHFGQPELWPRGLPPSHAFHSVNTMAAMRQDYPVHMWQCDNDPDVDAIGRMTYPTHSFRFHWSAPSIGLAQETWAPTNTQHTLLDLNYLPLFYIPITTPHRASDIARGYCLLPSLWSMGASVAYHGPLVWQERNEHNLVADLIEERCLYTGCERFTQLAWRQECNAMQLFRRNLEILHACGIVSDVAREQACYDVWLGACNDK